MKIILILIYLHIGISAGSIRGIFEIGGNSARISSFNNPAGFPLIATFGIKFFIIPFSSLIGAVPHRKYDRKTYSFSIEI